MVKEQALASFVHDYSAREQQQSCFNKCREIFDLSMTVLMVSVGRFVRYADREKSHRCCDQIKAGVGSLRQNAETAGAQPNDDL